jgi:uncharacterized membrane protein
MNWKLFGTVFAAVLLALIVFCSGLLYIQQRSLQPAAKELSK